NGVPLTDSAKVVGATAATLTIKGATGTDIGSYAVIVANTLGTAQSADASLSISSDGNAPVVITTWPTTNMTALNGRKYTNGTLMATAPQVPMSGSATDASGITNLTVSRVFPPWAPLDFNPTLFGINISKQWTNLVQLVDGTNTFRILATDAM